eukprot:505006-Rhodomonas_salina.3
MPSRNGFVLWPACVSVSSNLNHSPSSSRSCPKLKRTLIPFPEIAGKSPGPVNCTSSNALRKSAQFLVRNPS